MQHPDTDLPQLDSDYQLTDEQVESFRRNGHIYLPRVCTQKEVAAYRTVIRDAALANFKEMQSLEERDAYGKAFLQTLNLRYQSAAVRKFVVARRFASIAAQLVDQKVMRLYHDQALFKEPGGAHSPFHQDQYYWPLATDHALGMWMPLIDVSLDMGPILFASGSQTGGFAGQHAISDESQDIFEQVIKQRGFPIWQRAMQAGDATFHSGWTIHGASANNSSSMREAMIVTYYPDGTRVDKLSNPNRVGDAQNFLGGRQSGELADSEMNTVVYPGDQC